MITAVAGYFVILRGKTFNVGDRIRLGGVRGDVIDLGFIQTTIMEMGEPPPQNNEPGSWVQSRQFTGRDAVKEHELKSEVLAELQRRYETTAAVRPRVYYRLTDNWVELTVRFVVRDHGIREVKDAMSRDILAGLEAAGISIASGTYDIIGLPPIRVEGLNANNLVHAQEAT